MREVLPANPASELVAKQIKDLVGADLAMLIEKAQDGTFIDGVVSIGDGDVTWIMQVTDADGKLIADDKGFLGEDKVLEAAEKIAKNLFDKLCNPKAYHAKGRYNDLAIDHTVCDLTKPFTMQAPARRQGFSFR